MRIVRPGSIRDPIEEASISERLAMADHDADEVNRQGSQPFAICHTPISPQYHT